MPNVRWIKQFFMYSRIDAIFVTKISGVKVKVYEVSINQGSNSFG